MDITEYRRTARALREAEAKYRSLVEGLPAIVYIAEFGDDGDFTYISPQIESILGFTPEEFAAASVWRQRIVPEDQAAALGAELGVLRGEGRLQCEYRIVGKDDNLVWIREEADAVYNERGKPIYLQGVMYDITEQKNVEEQLVLALQAEQETNRIRSEFVLMINHELRTPLTSVVTGAELLNVDGLDEGDRRGSGRGHDQGRASTRRPHFPDADRGPRRESRPELYLGADAGRERPRENQAGGRPGELDHRRATHWRTKSFIPTLRL